jgi:hypothetical protein
LDDEPYTLKRGGIYPPQNENGNYQNGLPNDNDSYSAFYHNSHLLGLPKCEK